MSRWSVVLFVACGISAGETPTGSRAFAQDRIAPPVAGAEAPPPAAAPHEHRPVEVFGDPIVTRLPVRVRDPRRVAIDAEGRVVIADAAAGKVLRVAPADRTETLAADLDQPGGLVFDSAGILYVAVKGKDRPQDGTILRIDPAGMRTTLLRGLHSPTAIAVDAEDVLYVACAGAGTVLRVPTGGEPVVAAREVDSPVALAFHRGALFVASGEKGTVSRIDAEGRATIVAEGFMTLSDLAVGPEGALIVCDEADTLLHSIAADGSRSPYLSVPAGTGAVAFDRDGNLVAASGQLRIVVRLTSRLFVPCPHCDQRIPLRIRPRQPRPAAESDPI